MLWGSKRSRTPNKGPYRPSVNARTHISTRLVPQPHEPSALRTGPRESEEATSHLCWFHTSDLPSNLYPRSFPPTSFLLGVSLATSFQFFFFSFSCLRFTLRRLLDPSPDKKKLHPTDDDPERPRVTLPIHLVLGTGSTKRALHPIRIGQTTDSCRTDILNSSTPRCFLISPLTLARPPISFSRPSLRSSPPARLPNIIYPSIAPIKIEEAFLDGDSRHGQVRPDRPAQRRSALQQSQPARQSRTRRTTPSPKCRRAPPQRQCWTASSDASAPQPSRCPVQRRVVCPSAFVRVSGHCLGPGGHEACVGGDRDPGSRSQCGQHRAKTGRYHRSESKGDPETPGGGGRYHQKRIGTVR